jgi:hypothetical protein
VAHLVRPFHGTSIQRAYTDLNAARNTLLQALNEFNRPYITTACSLKRTLVSITPQGLIALTHHNYSEVVNQLATLERLIDAIAWAGNNIQLQTGWVEVCNPASSSERWPTIGITNDLILSSGIGIYLFEVSDTEGNHNRKMTKDIETLNKNQTLLTGFNKAIHRCLVCSKSSALYVVNKSIAKTCLPLGVPNNTYIVELL